MKTRKNILVAALTLAVSQALFAVDSSFLLTAIESDSDNPDGNYVGYSIRLSETLENYSTDQLDRIVGSTGGIPTGTATPAAAATAPADSTLPTAAASVAAAPTLPVPTFPALPPTTPTFPEEETEAPSGDTNDSEPGTPSPVSSSLSTPSNSPAKSAEPSNTAVSTPASSVVEGSDEAKDLPKNGDNLGAMLGIE
ncbi:MAG: hypothetical protein AAF226_18455, partial [Verrucomicrobiota bacterium]